METPIKDYYNWIIGFIETKPNGDKIAKDFNRRILGWYDAANNITKDFSLRIVAHGDVTSGLIWAEYQKSEEARKKKKK